MKNEVTSERTGWRDELISRRHRMWGFDCPAVDIDFLMLEYDHGKAAAIVEFKHERAAPVHLGHPSMRALAGLADAANIPFFLVRYTDQETWYYVTPGNARACELLPEAMEMTEPDWIKLLYRCRGRDVPQELSTTMV